MSMIALLQEKLPQLSASQHAKLCAYYELLLAGSKRMNLTAITDAREVADKHFVDSLLALPYMKQGASCIDIGTGAGFPGIPLLIARQDIQMTLLDSLQKRVRFLEETLAALGLRATLVCARAEDAGRRGEHRERYDIALSRAVAPLPVLLELCTPFVRVGGAALNYKGPGAEEEIAAAQNAGKLLNCELDVLVCKSAYGARNIVRAAKRKSTPACYPRRAGDPAREPL